VSLRAATASQRAPSTPAMARVHSSTNTRSSLALSSRTHVAGARPVQASRVARVAARRAPAAVVAMAEASKDKTVLVVGATGYIGRFVTKVHATGCPREDELWCVMRACSLG
jgi:FlaA1/EpsC-like NDP-sugar epimerase